ncbi:MAG: zinc-binding dehydrogenase [Crenarchaeota archaeon]|nr:zinc-binding dehydrogenase [Thermoproteota archaeon]
MRRKVAVLVEKGRIDIVEEEIPSLGKEDVLIKVRACGICTGDLYGFSGYPVWFKLPSPLGHEPAGEVVEAGANVTRFSKGDRVAALGGPGFSDFVLVNESQVEKIPDNVPFEYAIGEPLACVVNAVRLVNPKFGDNVAVVGTGFMGLLLIQALGRLCLRNLVGIDVINERLRLAEHYGASIALNPKEKDVGEETLAITEGKGFDIVIEATGNPGGVGLATKLVKQKGRLAIFSYHPNPVSVDLREWDSKGLEVIMTSPSRAEDMRENFKIAVGMLSKGVFNLERLITHKWILNDIQKAFEYASKKPSDYIKGVIIP